MSVLNLFYTISGILGYNVDFINIDEFPVIYEDYWKIKGSTYEIVDNEYENIDLFFVSYDSGKTWSLDE